jgi:predicted dehydrogenase
MNPRYGVLLVTGGHTHQENYGAAFAADPRCRIIALSDDKNVDRRRRDLNERLAKQFKVPYIDDLDQALADRNVNLVSVCSEPDRRGPIALRCAKAGKTLYLDKSLCPSVREADELVAEVRRSRLKSHMFSFISQPWAKQAKRLLAGKKLGRLLAIHAECFFAKGRTGTADLQRPRREEFPPRRHQLIEAKREMDNCGVYPITLIRWLTGRSFRTIHCVTGNYFFQEHQKANVEDFGLITGTMDEGLPFTISTGRFGWSTHPGFGANRLMFIGTEQTLVVDAHRPRLEVYTDEPPWTPPNTHPQDPMGFWSSTMQEVHMRPKTMWTLAGEAFTSDAAYFLDRLDANQDSEINAAEAALSTEVLVAAYQSAAEKRVVTLPLPRG